MNAKKSGQIDFGILVEETQMGVIFIDSDLKIKYYNAYCKNLFKKKAIIKNKTKISFLLSKNVEVVKIIEKEIRKGGKDFQTPVFRDNETKMNLSINGRKIRGGFLLGIVDIDKIAPIEQMKREFVSLASHQLLTPLSGMKYFCEMLLGGEAGNLTNEQERYLNEIYSGIKRTIILIKAFMDVSKFESGAVVLKNKKVDVNKLVQDIADDYGRVLSAKNCGLMINIKTKSKFMVFADPSILKMVIENFLDNAIKYSKKNEGFISIIVENKKKQCLLSVKDNGIGIPKKEQCYVFEKFYRTANGSKVNVDGNGLGLYLSKLMVTALNGKIWFESKENVGTVFHLSLPII